MKEINFEKVFSIALGVFSFLIIGFPKLSSLGVILLGLIVFFGFVKKQLSWKFNVPGVLMMLIYVAYLVGILFAHELAIGLKYAEYKLGLFIIPLLLSIQPNFKLSIHSSVIGAILGVIVALIPGIMNSCDCYSEHGWLLYCFSSSYISTVHHPSYFAGFILITVVAAWYGRFAHWKGFTNWTVSIYSVLGIGFYFLCLTLAGILFFGILIAGIIIYYSIRKFGFKLTIPLGIVVIFLMMITAYNLPWFEKDIKTTTASYEKFMDDSQSFLIGKVGEEEIPGNQIRIIMWAVTTELIMEHPFGVGTGNVDEYLTKRLNDFGLTQVSKMEYNPHNQYLQTTLEIGFIGLLLLVFMIVSALWFAWKNKSYVLFILVAGLAFNCLFESMLQRQSGVVFYSFWISLLIVSINTHKRLNE